MSSRASHASDKSGRDVAEHDPLGPVRGDGDGPADRTLQPAGHRVSNLAAQSRKLYHLGVGVVTRSSLARVNAEKPW